VTRLWVKPLALDASDPARRDLGRLRFLGGWEMGSDDHRFGSISAMHVGEEEVLGFSDAGLLIRFARPDRRTPETAWVSILPEGPGTPTDKTNRDIESMAAAGESAWIAFERNNSVWRYDSRTWRREASARPEAMRKWKANLGAEAMLRLAGGRFLIFAEGRGGEGPALLFEGDPAVPGTRAIALGYRPPSGYRITDAALLPDGTMLFLNRRFRLVGGISAKLTAARPRLLAAGMAIEGEEIAELRPPVAVDNMEALSITHEGGRTILWIASDDNFNPLQRTILLKFALPEPLLRPLRSPPPSSRSRASGAAP
jgi:hypothetical protein